MSAVVFGNNDGMSLLNWETTAMGNLPAHRGQNLGYVPFAPGKSRTRAARPRDRPEFLGRSPEGAKRSALVLNLQNRFLDPQHDMMNVA